MATYPPYAKTPLTDLGGCMFTQQSRPGLCADIELNLMKCREAYGLVRAEKECKDYFADLYECQNSIKQILRSRKIKEETQRQLKAGTITKAELEKLNPAPDSYQS